MPVMKYLTCLVLLSAILFSCSNNDKEQHAETDEVIIDSSGIKTGTELPENTITLLNNTEVYRTSTAATPFDWNHFKLTKFWTEDTLLSTPFEPAGDYYKNYGSFLVYSPDSNRFIDLDSYNLHIRNSGNGKLVGQAQGPDTEISLVDKKKNVKTRLLFFGPGNSVEDAKWIDNENLLLIGTIEGGEESKLNAAIFKYNIPSRTFQVFETGDAEIIKHLKGYSKRERLKSVTIQ